MTTRLGSTRTTSVSTTLSRPDRHPHPHSGSRGRGSASAAATSGSALLTDVHSCLRVWLLWLQPACLGVLWVRRACGVPSRCGVLGGGVAATFTATTGSTAAITSAAFLSTAVMSATPTVSAATATATDTIQVVAIPTAGTSIWPVLPGRGGSVLHRSMRGESSFLCTFPERWRQGRGAGCNAGPRPALLLDIQLGEWNLLAMGEGDTVLRGLRRRLAL